MSYPSCFVCNADKISHETIDGEVVIINLESGAYYSLDNSAAQIWGFIEKGYSNGAMVKELESLFQGRSRDIESAVERFMKELHAEDLIIPVEATQSQVSEGQTGRGDLMSEKERPSFEPPTFQKYTDMQELLLLDPIHEVDEAGWPHAKPNPVE